MITNFLRNEGSQISIVFPGRPCPKSYLGRKMCQSPDIYRFSVGKICWGLVRASEIPEHFPEERLSVSEHYTLFQNFNFQEDV